MVTLGCSKNLVDSERLMRQLVANGYTVAHDPEAPGGDIAVINTCGFIGDAKEESINMILSFAEAKKRNKVKKLFVMGCLSERYRNELIEEIPEVEGVDGTGMMLGIRLKTKTSGEAAKACVANGLLILTAKQKLRLLPPLTITYEEIDKGLEILKKTLA